MWSLSTCIKCHRARVTAPVAPRAWVLLLLICLPITVHGGRLESLVSPGPLSDAHARYDGQCDKCHSNFDKADQDTLCLDCHDRVAADVRAERGFHGRSPAVGNADCRQCHTEHRGRDEDIVGFNPDTFDHRGTDFALEGAHRRLSCDRCHAPADSFHEAPSACIDCHRDTDPHRGRLGRTCDDCHSQERWSEVRFDHAETGYALEGAHRQDVACASCHPDQRYADTPRECNACHALNDVHAGRNGKDCAACHTVRKWDEPRFDHANETDFPLRERHALIPCASCHTISLKEPKLKTNCVSCHRPDDQHQGRNGTRCEDCHSERRWSDVRFDHDHDTDFALRGAHRGISCTACHRGNVHEEKLETGCVDCHRADDPHRGQQGERCERCHNEDSWDRQVLFDHGLTRFPLIGLHATVPCEECHLTAGFRDTSRRCVDCHGADDAHQGALGDKCATCHNPNDWGRWTFDHARQTDYPLEGAHAGLTCAACHRPGDDSRADDTPTRCNVCHAKDDIHSGGFGQTCERCHSTESFHDLTLSP